RVDFGPNGRLDTFVEWGVVQFIMTSKTPWPEFTELQAHLAEKPPPYDPYSGSLERAGRLYDQLSSEGLVGVVAPDLVAFAKEHTSLNTEGIAVQRLPPGTPDRTYFDVSVAERKVVTDKGHALLASQRLA